MNKQLLLFMAFMLTASLGFSQKVLVDFEEGNLGFTPFGADAWTGDPLFSVIENPDKSGINPSDSIGQYLEPNEGEPWMGMFFNPEEPVELTSGQTELCASVWVSEAATLTIKVENPATGLNFEPPPIDVTTTGEWVQICQDFAGTAAEGETATVVVIFFNIGSVPAAPTPHFFDDIVQPGVMTSTGEVPIDQRIGIFPNPVRDQLNFDFNGTNPTTVMISDLTGKQVMKPTRVTSNSIDISNLIPGIYYVTLRDKNNEIISTKKMIKQ
ncbi:MAG: T9SS type A sorting domain-containing protein [Phaeodactylibacter sp.]|uniref:T9SS type A sorting domain-containing protein n=1 Tax=Phaeodactylibacter sp. TaxID=1940289 RepID=UPI0032EAE248